jgi:TatD-related deoxyribonuclease
VNGRHVEAVEEYARLGGTHLLVLNKPSWHLGTEVEEPADFREPFELTLEAVERASERLPGRAWPVLGVHPALVSQLSERGFGPGAARELMCGGLDIAAEYVSEGRALAIKSGRPHYEVSEAVWTASNEVMDHAFSLGAEVGCAVQLHTEGGTDLTALTDRAGDRGLDRERVVKHFAEGGLQGPTPSIIARKEEIQRALEHGRRFMLETDFIDDPDRPGAVLGPKTVPKRTAWLLENGHETAVDEAHVDTPARVYGIDTEGTLGG